MSEKILEFLDYAVKNLVQSPDNVTLNVTEKSNINHISIKVDKNDMGRVIGKGGKIVNSLRNIVQAMAQKQNQKVELEIEEN